MNAIENWFLAIGSVNLILFIIGLFLFMPKKIFKTTLPEYYQIFSSHLKYIVIIIGVVAFHLVEVNLLDSYFTNLVGVDFASNIQMIEDGFVYWFSQNWIPFLVYFFVLMYIVVYPFTLWFSPLYFLLTDDKKAMKSLSYGLLLLYVIALPFYLFFPVTNVYTFHGAESALGSAIPNVEQFFYSTTTYNNCLPSLHVAMALLIAKSVYLTENKKYTYFVYFCTISVILSVIYLAIHWLTDVICGVILAFSVFYLQKRFIKEDR
ncbi:MAG: phosphatase PAP2 family protein [Thermoplasmatales archaeon]|nr:MAG: phosphatase PAP2 family protein [Thermoplasmatales archaeon]